MIDNKIKKICLDFDSTLGHSFYADDEKHADQLLEDYSEHWRGEKFELIHGGWDNTPNNWFVTFKRSWADDLIKFSRDIVGSDNVYILTAASRDYINLCNKKLELGFDPDKNIFSREDMNAVNKSPVFIDSYNILVDDLPYREHLGKISHKAEFLNMLPESQYIKVNPFTVWIEKLGKNSKYFDSIKNKIEKLIKTEI